MSAISTLDAIREKVRKVTGRPSENQISTEQIDFYVNTFYLYDMPEQLRLFDLKTNFVFTTESNINEYDFPVEEFSSVEIPFYVDGYEMVYHQDQQAFFNTWPKINFEENVGTGDGLNSSPVLSDLVSVPVIRNCVTLAAKIGDSDITFIDDGEGSFRSEKTNITAVTLDSPAQITTETAHNYVTGDNVFIDNVFGPTNVNGGPYIATVIDPITFTIPISTVDQDEFEEGSGTTQVQRGTVDYITGELTMDWGNPPDAGTDILAHTVPYSAARPTDVLFFDQKFNFRPVPDKAYKVEVEAYRFPTQLLAGSQSPRLRQWWQYLAYGAALKIFADSAELEALGNFTVLFKEQERLVLRRTLRQLTTQRVSTPYTEEQTFPYGNFYPLI